jgi:hypothetical protein
MITLDAEVLLFHLLSREDFAETGITFGDLRRMKNAIHERPEFKELNIYLLISTPDLSSAIEQFPKYFSWKENQIVRAPYSDDVYSEWNRHLAQFDSDKVPQNIADIVYETIHLFPHNNPLILSLS